MRYTYFTGRHYQWGVFQQNMPIPVIQHSQELPFSQTQVSEVDCSEADIGDVTLPARKRRTAPEKHGG